MELKIFENSDFGTIRAIEQNGEPWFVAKDVCEVLEIKNTTDAIKRLDDDEVTRFNLGGLSGETNIVNEFGLYNLILGSRKTEAKAFKRWITHEVIPSIRKTGGYINGQEQMTPEQVVANALIVAQNIIEEKQKQLETMKPKAEFYDAVAGSKGAIEIGVAAKVLGVKGVGRNKLFEILREKKVLMSNNIPYQRYIDLGYFRTIEQKWTTRDGETRISIKTLVFQKGLDFIRKEIGA